MATDQPQAWAARLRGLGARFDELRDVDEDDDRENHDKDFLAIMRDACQLVRDATAGGAHEGEEERERAELLAAVDAFLNDGIDYAYGGDAMFDFLPSFAHVDGDAPLVKEEGHGFSQGMLSGLMPFMLKMMDFMKPGTNAQDVMDKMPKPPPAWTPAMKPHPNSTFLMRPCEGALPTTPTAAHPLAQIIYQGRCEIDSEDICTPYRMALSPDGAVLALSMAGGYKNRDPVLGFHTLGDAPVPGLEGDGADMPKLRYVKESGLGEPAHALALDGTRRLLFAADGHRIKSWRYGAPDAPGKPLAVHTLRSHGHTGPLAVLPGGAGRVVRAGKAGAAVWDLDVGEDVLPTHGPKGTTRVGRGAYSADDSWRDDPEEIERSSGALPARTVAWADAGVRPSVWAPHPSKGAEGVMLAAMDPRASDRDNKSYSCIALDLEHGGKTAGRWLGHGGTAGPFSTSAGDPNAFATACSDGYARLFDVRQPLPVMTFDVTNSASGCNDVVLAHPDGIPSIFTGGASTKEIRLWDIRARTPVYNLATGNNDVVSLAWDVGRSTLYAATECAFKDRLGYHHDYRKAKIPKTHGAPRDKTPEPENAGEPDPAAVADDGDDDAWVDDDGDDEEEEDEFDDDDDCFWPQKAQHGETYFGYAFDAGDHRVYRYAFKENANTNRVPPYGEGRIENAGYGW